MARLHPTRRQWILGVGVVLAGLPRLGRAAEPRGKVLLIGDSMIATALGQRLEHGLSAEGFRVHRRGKSSSGLARPDFFDWPGEATKLMEKHAPDAVVVMMGGNDAQSLRTPNGWIKWGDAAWREEYLRRVGELLGIVAPAGEPVCWVGLPIVRSPGYRRKIELVNALVEEQVGLHPGASFVSTWSVLAKAGQYAESMNVGGKDETLRGSDGVHLTVAGARLLESQIRPQVVQALAAVADAS